MGSLGDPGGPGPFPGPKPIQACFKEPFHARLPHLDVSTNPSSFSGLVVWLDQTDQYLPAFRKVIHHVANGGSLRR